MIKYLFSVLTSTVISMCFLAVFAFLPAKGPVNCNNSKYSEFSTYSVCNDHVVKDSFSLDDIEKLLEIKEIIEGYLSSNAVKKLERDTVEFLQDVLNNINVKLELFS